MDKELEKFDLKEIVIKDYLHKVCEYYNLDKQIVLPNGMRAVSNKIKVGRFPKNTTLIRKCECGSILESWDISNYKLIYYHQEDEPSNNHIFELKVKKGEDFYGYNLYACPFNIKFEL